MHGGFMRRGEDFLQFVKGIFIAPLFVELASCSPSFCTFCTFCYIPLFVFVKCVPPRPWADSAILSVTFDFPVYLPSSLSSPPLPSPRFTSAVDGSSLGPAVWLGGGGATHALEQQCACLLSQVRNGVGLEG